MLSLIVSAIDLSVLLLVSVSILLLKFILDKCRPDPRFRKIDSQVPGPPPWPIFGNSLSFIFAGKDGQIELQAKNEKKYGRIYRMWIGNKFVVQLSNPDDLEAVFTNSKLLGKGQLFKSFNRSFGDILFSAIPVPLWKKNRKRLQPFFTRQVVSSLAPEMNKAADRVIQKLKKCANGPEIEITTLIFDLSLNFVSKSIYDFEIPENEKLINELKFTVESNLDFLSVQMFLPFLNTNVFRFFVDKLFVMPARTIILNFARKVISKKVSDIRNGTYNTEGGMFLSELFLSSYNTTENEITLLEETAELIFAAAESTMKTITFCLLMIAMHPEVQDKLYEEIREVLGDDNRQADINDCDRLIYLNQVLKETMRKFPVIPVLVRIAEDDVKIGPYTFPEGTQFMINIGAINQNSELYSNPHEFNPDHFSPQAEEKRPKYSSLSFSAGARNCIGKTMAELEMKIFLVAVLRTFTLHTKKTMKDLKITPGLIGRSDDGIWLSFKLRNPK